MNLQIHDHLNMMSNSISISAAARPVSAEGQFKAAEAGGDAPCSSKKERERALH